MGLCPATRCRSRDLRRCGQRSTATLTARPSPDPLRCQTAEPPAPARDCSPPASPGQKKHLPGPTGHRTVRDNVPEPQDRWSGAKPRGAESTVRGESGQRQQGEDSDHDQERGRPARDSVTSAELGPAEDCARRQAAWSTSHQDRKPRGQRQVQPSAGFPEALIELPAHGTVAWGPEHRKGPGRASDEGLCAHLRAAL